jgi:hypothetical protein
MYAIAEWIEDLVFLVYSRTIDRDRRASDEVLQRTGQLGTIRDWIGPVTQAT